MLRLVCPWFDLVSSWVVFSLMNAELEFLKVKPMQRGRSGVGCPHSDGTLDPLSGTAVSMAFCRPGHTVLHVVREL